MDQKYRSRRIGPYFRFFLGELKGAYWINAITLFNAKLKDTMPSLRQVKVNVMVMYKYEEHKCKMKNKEHVFEKHWGLFKNHLNI